MANLKIEIDASKLSEGDMDAKIMDGTNPDPFNGVIQCRNLLEAILAGAVDAEVVVTCIESSKTATYNLK
jgi:hypothetical protein